MHTLCIRTLSFTPSSLLSASFLDEQSRAGESSSNMRCHCYRIWCMHSPRCIPPHPTSSPRYPSTTSTQTDWLHYGECIMRQTIGTRLRNNRFARSFNVWKKVKLASGKNYGVQRTPIAVQRTASWLWLSADVVQCNARGFKGVFRLFVMRGFLGLR